MVVLCNYLYLYIHRDDIITRRPQLSTESAFQLEAAAFNGSNNMVSLLV